MATWRNVVEPRRGRSSNGRWNAAPPSTLSGGWSRRAASGKVRLAGQGSGIGEHGSVGSPLRWDDSSVGALHADEGAGDREPTVEEGHQGTKQTGNLKHGADPPVSRPRTTRVNAPRPMVLAPTGFGSPRLSPAHTLESKSRAAARATRARCCKTRNSRDLVERRYLWLQVRRMRAFNPSSLSRTETVPLTRPVSRYPRG